VDELREREERVVKKRRLAEDLKRCVELQRQWQTIQKLIEAEEERIAEECRVQRHRLRFLTHSHSSKFIVVNFGQPYCVRRLKLQSST